MGTTHSLFRLRLPGWDSHNLLRKKEEGRINLIWLQIQATTGIDLQEERREHSWNIPSDLPCIVHTCHAPLHLNQAPFANHGGL